MNLHHLAGFQVHGAEQRTSVSKSDPSLQYFSQGQLIIPLEHFSEAGRQKTEEWSKKTIPPTLDEAVDQLINEYQIAINAADNDEKKLLAISNFAWGFDHLHPFSDGNIRTVNLLITKLLIENDLQPTMLWNPNILDTHSPEEVVVAIKEGQERYRRRFSVPVSAASNDLDKYIAMLSHTQGTSRFADMRSFARTAKGLCDSFPDSKQIIAEQLLTVDLFKNLSLRIYEHIESFKDYLKKLLPGNDELIDALITLSDLRANAESFKQYKSAHSVAITNYAKNAIRRLELEINKLKDGRVTAREINCAVVKINDGLNMLLDQKTSVSTEAAVANTSNEVRKFFEVFFSNLSQYGSIDSKGVITGNSHWAGKNVNNITMQDILDDALLLREGGQYDHMFFGAHARNATRGNYTPVTREILEKNFNVDFSQMDLKTNEERLSYIKNKINETPATQTVNRSRQR